MSTAAPWNTDFFHCPHQNWVWAGGCGQPLHLPSPFPAISGPLVTPPAVLWGSQWRNRHLFLARPERSLWGLMKVHKWAKAWYPRLHLNMKFWALGTGNWIPLGLFATSNTTWAPVNLPLSVLHWGALLYRCSDRTVLKEHTIVPWTSRTRDMVLALSFHFVRWYMTLFMFTSVRISAMGFMDDTSTKYHILKTSFHSKTEEPFFQDQPSIS